MIRCARLCALAALLAVLAAACHHAEEAGVTGGRLLVVENTSRETGLVLPN